MCALDVSEPGNELAKKVDQSGPNATSSLVLYAALSNASPGTPRYTWPAPVAEPFASQSTFPQEAMAMWPRTIQGALSVGAVSQRPKSALSVGWKALY